MKTIGNILWVVLFGIWAAFGWLLWAALFAITIIGLPFARQCLKLARFTLWPFGYTAVRSPTARAAGALGNILWFIPGVLMAIGYALSGAFLCITIIGIPFGLQAFKFIPLAVSPFGKEVLSIKELNARVAAGTLSHADAIAVPASGDEPAPRGAPLPPAAQ